MSAAKALEAAVAFAVLIEMVPEEVGAEITRSVAVPTVGIGADSGCDAQVLVWQDMAGLRTGRLPRLVKQYADVHGVLREAARDFVADVSAGCSRHPSTPSDRSSQVRQRRRLLQPGVWIVDVRLRGSRVSGLKLPLRQLLPS